MPNPLSYRGLPRRVYRHLRSSRGWGGIFQQQRIDCRGIRDKIKDILINTMRPRKRDLIFFSDFYLVFQNNYFILLFLATVPYQHHHHHPHRIISVSYSIRLELDRARSLYSMVIYLTYSHLNAISVFSFPLFVRKFAIIIIIMLLC